jgi:hypothetical protein
MTDLAKLVVRLEAQTAAFDAKLDQANKKLSKFQKSTDGSLKAINNSFSQLQKGLAVVGIGASVAAIASGFVNAAKSAIEFGDEVNKAVAKTGVSAEAFSELAYAAKQSDIEMVALSTAFKKMQQAVSQAGTGSKQALDIFAALQLNFEQLRKMSPDEQFSAIAEQISRIKDPADKTRAAVALFGKAGADLLPMFEQGAEGIRLAREEAERMGATLTGEQARQLAEADDAIKRLGQAWDGVTRSLVLGVTPGLTSALNAMNNALSTEPKVWSLAEAWDAAGRAFSKNGIGTTWTDLIAEMEKGTPPTERSSKGTPPGGRNRKRSEIDFSLPEDDSKKAAAAATAAQRAAEAAARAHLKVLEDQADAYKSVLDAGMAAIDGLKTPVEQQIQQYHEAKFALEELARTFPNMADQAAEALKRLEIEGLEDIVITAEIIVPEEAVQKTNVFLEEASRNTQNIIADNLMNGFDDGAKGMLRSFADMLKQMAAQAIAAKIAQAIFGDGGQGSGGGWIGTLTKMASSFFGGGGFSDGGYTGLGVKSKVAGVVHAGEWVLPKERVDEPGASKFLRAFQERGMKLFEQRREFDSAAVRSNGKMDRDLMKRLMKAMPFGGLRDSGGRGDPGKAYMIGTGAQPEMFVPDQPGKFIPADQMAPKPPVIKLRNVNAFDTSVVRDYLLSADGEEVFLNVMDRNGSRVRAAASR